MSRKIETMYDNVQLSIVHSVTKQKLVSHKGAEYPELKEVNVKQIYVQKWFKKEGITSVEEYVTSKNKIAKSRSIVFDKYSGRFYATYHSPKEVMESINRIKTNPIGYDNSVHGSRSQVRKY